ncbi:MAG: hypothetical protein RSD38_04600, partial [Raoultibacter sp.]
MIKRNKTEQDSTPCQPTQEPATPAPAQTPAAQTPSQAPDAAPAEPTAVPQASSEDVLFSAVDVAPCTPDADAAAEALIVPDAPVGKKAHGGHAAKPDLPAHHKKSRRMRRLLIVVVCLLVVLMGVLAVLSYMLVQETQNAALQQVTQDVEAVGSQNTKDASTTVVKKTTVPALVGILGKTQAEAVKLIGHGALAAPPVEVKEEGNPIKSKVTVTLTDEPADTRSGAPTVYLGFNEAGTVVQAGYSAATASLGYGSLSFTDAIQNEKIIEATFAEAGLTLPAGSVVLPTDKMKYSTYATDGKTLLKENCSFSGTAEAGGVAYSWSAVLMYDYAAANASGNLADTIRQVYIY